MLTTLEKVKVMQAFIDGKDIEISNHKGGWEIFECIPVWNWVSNEYRIKPPPLKEIWVNKYPNGNYAIHSSLKKAEEFLCPTGVTTHYKEVLPD